MKVNLPHTPGFVAGAWGFSLEQTADNFVLSQHNEIALMADTLGEIKTYLLGWWAGRQCAIPQDNKTAAAIMGSSTSPAKVEAARINGARGGRPKKTPI